MVRMKKDVAITAITNKTDELLDKAELIKGNESLSKNTRQTQAYGLRKNARILLVLKEFVKMTPEDEFDLDDSIFDWFMAATILAEDTKHASRIVVSKGDKLMDLLSAYKDIKDPFGKIQKACAVAGLTINMTTGIIE